METEPRTKIVIAPPLQLSSDVRCDGDQSNYIKWLTGSLGSLNLTVLPTRTDRQLSRSKMAPRAGRASLRRVLEHCCPLRAAAAGAGGPPTAAAAAASGGPGAAKGFRRQYHQDRRGVAPAAAAAGASSAIPWPSRRLAALGAVRGIMHRAGQPAGWAKTAAEASLDVIVDAVTRPKARREVRVPSVKVNGRRDAVRSIGECGI